MRVNHDVVTSSSVDFQIDDMEFEIGGKNKQQKQLAGVSRGYIIKDDIETGYGNIIPLWQFGLEY